MAVADVFDALVSKRVYKTEVPADQAFTVLEEAGSHFDPQIVEIFPMLIEEIESYLSQT